MSSYNIGIDLGTTNTACCTMNNGKFQMIKLQRKEVLPSVLLYKDDEIMIGDKAKKRAQLFASNYIKSSKTSIGNKEINWNIEGKMFTPQTVARHILETVNDSAKKYFKTDEKISAVITVPAYFTAKQRLETKEAGIEAGLDVKKIITEPVAAAISYGFEDDLNQRILVVDLGGGTFDVSVLKIENSIYYTLSIEGDSHLGGDDFDNIIMQMIFRNIRKEFGVDLSNYQSLDMVESEYMKTIQNLSEKAELAKIDLSESEEVDIELPNLFKLNDRLVSTTIKITRDQFKYQSFTLIEKIKKTILKALNKSSLTKNDIDKVILVGGSSNMPFIKELINEELGQNPYSDRDLSKLVAMGAALVAYEGEVIIRENQINDIICHSLGTTVKEDEFSIIIPKGTKYPVEVTKVYTTVDDYQKAVNIDIYEGESDCVNENDYYGDFELSNIQEAAAGVPKIHITFSVDKNQILHAKAVDIGTNSNEGMTVNLRK